MNISSILITIVGIIIILALYVLSRMGQNNLPKTDSSELPVIKDDNGGIFTSVLDDIAATDGSSIDTSKLSESKRKQEVTKKSNNKSQIVLFISGQDEKGLDGNLIKTTLLKNGLYLGEKDIYHYFLENENQSNSLFRVANGVEPWTLTDKDLNNKHIIGISLVMLLPNLLTNKEALAKYLQMAETITSQVNGVLKNQTQEPLTALDRKNILKL